jgi:hypothetical protein
MVAQTFLSVSGRGVEGIPALPSRPETFLRVRSGGRNAPTRGLATDKNVCPTSETDKNACLTSARSFVTTSRYTRRKAGLLARLQSPAITDTSLRAGRRPVEGLAGPCE